MSNVDMVDRAPYEGTPESQQILRDQLALDRTTLANERTLLAYVRTSLALFLTGVSAMHLPGFQTTPAAEAWLYELAGWLFVALSAITLANGYLRYRRVRRQILAAAPK